MELRKSSKSSCWLLELICAAFLQFQLVYDALIVLGIGEDASDLLDGHSALVFDVVIQVFCLFLLLSCRIWIFLFVLILRFLLVVLFAFDFICILFMVVFDPDGSLSTFCVKIVDSHEHFGHVQVFLLVLVTGPLQLRMKVLLCAQFRFQSFWQILDFVI